MGKNETDPYTKTNKHKIIVGILFIKFVADMVIPNSWFSNLNCFKLKKINQVVFYITWQISCLKMLLPLKLLCFFCFRYINHRHIINLETFRS